MGLFSRTRPAPSSAAPPRDIDPLYPSFYQATLTDTGTPLTVGNVVALAGLAASNLALNAVLWFDQLGDEAAKHRWMQRFGNPDLQPDLDHLVRVPDEMIDFLWAWDRRAHGGLREYVGQMHDVLRSGANKYGDELPLDMWGADE